jgi:hypothetical protein
MPLLLRPNAPRPSIEELALNRPISFTLANTTNENQDGSVLRSSLRERIGSTQSITSTGDSRSTFDLGEEAIRVLDESEAPEDHHQKQEVSYCVKSSNSSTRSRVRSNNSSCTCSEENEHNGEDRMSVPIVIEERQLAVVNAELCNYKRGFLKKLFNRLTRRKNTTVTLSSQRFERHFSQDSMARFFHFTTTCNTQTTTTTTSTTI